MQIKEISQLPAEIVTPVMGSKEFLSARSPVNGYLTDGKLYLPYFVENKLGIFKYMVFSNIPFPDTGILTTAFTTACIDHVISQKTCDFIYQPLSHCVFTEVLPNADNRRWATPIVRLEESAENLLKRFHSKHRYEIKKAQKQDHSFVVPTESELHNLLAANSVGNPNYTYPSEARLKALKQNLGDRAAIYGIQSSGKLVAAALILSDASHAYYVYGGSLKGSIGWMHLLQWQIMHTVAKQGIEYYDLVGLRPPEGEDQKYEGLAKFKTRFSPEIISGYTFWVPVSAFKVWVFRFLLKIRKVLTGREFKL